VFDQFLGPAVAVNFCSVDQGHAKGNASTECFFFSSCRMSSLRKMPGALTQRGHGSAIAKLHGPPRVAGGQTGGRVTSPCCRYNRKRAERCPKQIKFSTIYQLSADAVHSVISQAGASRSMAGILVTAVISAKRKRADNVRPVASGPSRSTKTMKLELRLIGRSAIDAAVQRTTD